MRQNPQQKATRCPLFNTHSEAERERARSADSASAQRLEAAYTRVVIEYNLYLCTKRNVKKRGGEGARRLDCTANRNKRLAGSWLFRTQPAAHQAC